MVIRVKLVCALLLMFTSLALSSASCQTLRNWTIAGKTREALLFQPTVKVQNGPLPPVVFAFHGHGGGMYQASRSFKIQQYWPEALVVYMQGLPTPGALTDPAGAKNGWQSRSGDQDNRDIQFFDAVLKSLTDEKQIDHRRVFVTGHSNGGGFTYLLWQCRAEKVRAFAPVAAIAGRDFTRDACIPKPVLHIMGLTDPLVRPRWQELTIETVRRINGGIQNGTPWEKAGEITTTIYNAPKGATTAVGVHPGGHTYPSGAAELIVKFFKLNDLRAG